MKFSLKINFLAHFKYFYSIIGSKLLLFLGLSILISFLDGMGLAMFIPLLKVVSDGQQAAADSQESLGQLRHVIGLIKKMGFELTVTTVLMCLVTMFVFKGILKYTQMKFYAGLRELFTKKVRYRLVNNLEGLSYSAFLKIDSGKIQNTLTTEVQRLFQSFSYYFTAAQAAVMLMTYMFL